MDDLEFIASCVKGDKKVWDEFVERYSRLIYRYIHNVLKTKGFDCDEETINDLYQAIFLSLVENNYKKLRSFKARQGCSFASWLRTVTINFTLDYLRRYRQDESLDAQPQAEGELSLMDILKDDSEPVDFELLGREKLSSLADCIERLDIDEQYFIDLHLHQGVAIKDMARMAYASVSRASLDMRKRRILDKLKECFKKKIPEYFR